MFACTLNWASADRKVPVGFICALMPYCAVADATAPLSSNPIPRTPAVLNARRRVTFRVLGFISLPLCGFELLDAGKQALDRPLQRRVLLGQLLHRRHRDDLRRIGVDLQDFVGGRLA